MAFGHRQLEVHKRAMDAVAKVARISDRIPDRDRWLAIQLRRSMGAVVLNLAEAAGEFSGPEKARILRIARREAYESADALLLVTAFGDPDRELIDETDKELDEIAGMLTSLAKKMEQATLQRAARTRTRTRNPPSETR